MPNKIQSRVRQLADQRMVAWAAPRAFAVNSNGNRNIPYLDQNGSHWNLNWNWLDNNFNSNGRVARSRKRGNIKAVARPGWLD